MKTSVSVWSAFGLLALATATPDIRALQDKVPTTVSKAVKSLSSRALESPNRELSLCATSGLGEINDYGCTCSDTDTSSLLALSCSPEKICGSKDGNSVCLQNTFSFVLASPEATYNTCTTVVEGTSNTTMIGMSMCLNMTIDTSALMGMSTDPWLKSCSLEMSESSCSCNLCTNGEGIEMGCDGESWATCDSWNNDSGNEDISQLLGIGPQMTASMLSDMTGGTPPAPTASNPPPAPTASNPAPTPAAPTSASSSIVAANAIGASLLATFSLYL